MHTTRPVFCQQFPKVQPAAASSSSAGPASTLSKGLGSLPDRVATSDKKRNTNRPDSLAHGAISDDVLINSQTLDTESEGTGRTSDNGSSVALTVNSNIISHIGSSSEDNYSDPRPAQSQQQSLDQAWVVFDPLEQGESDEYSNEGDDDHDLSAWGTNKNEPGAATPTPRVDGTLTPLAFPAHNGSGSFLDQLNQSMAAAAAAAAAASTESSLLSDKSMDRINAWRINQSQHILKEFSRLEKRSRLKAQASQQQQDNLHSPSGAASTTTSSASVDSHVSSWGLPEEEDDEDYLLHSHDEIAAALAGPDIASSSSLSSRSAMAVSIIAEELSHILGNNTTFETAVRLILNAAEEAYQTIHRPDALDQALNAILDPSLSLDFSAQSGLYTSTGTSTPTPASVAAASAQQSKCETTLWQFIKTKVLHDFIGLNDEILEVIFGERFIDPDQTDKEQKSSSQAKSTKQSIDISKGISECRQAGSYSEYGNYMSKNGAPSASPPNSFSKVLERKASKKQGSSSNTDTGANQRLVQQVSHELMSALRKKQQKRSTLHKRPSAAQQPPTTSPMSVSVSALQVRDVLRARLMQDLASTSPSASASHYYAESSVGSSKRRCAAGAATAPGSHASTKRARHSVDPSEASESNYWEMSSASGNGSESGQLIGVW